MRLHAPQAAIVIVACAIVTRACARLDQGNERTRPSAAVGKERTPLDQGNTMEDLAISQHVRKAVLDDSSLSMTAKNVRIITDHGVVTLRGLVERESEKSIITARAREIADVVRVEDQLVVSK